MSDVLTFDGAELPFSPGDTVAAVLINAGILSWRTTRINGKRRGLFCGIGVCFDCLVTINGTSSVRACVTEAQAGDTVTTQIGDGHDV